jgi:arylsulfatase A
MNRRELLRSGALALSSLTLGSLAKGAARRPPNFIVVLCDDLGYGDIAALGAKRVRTPHLDRMVREGTLLTDFYAAANLCTPSRAGLLTGRYPIRTGLAYEVILSNDQRGLPQEEVTIAEVLRPEYATALVGKWHLGHVAPYWPPTVQGFDLFFGLPYSHDIMPLSLYESGGPGVELTKEDVDFPQLQQRFYARAERFIEDHRDRPFFLDLALSAPHLPSYPHPAHEGHSNAGTYGDVVEEVDALMGRLFAKLKALGIERDTLVMFTSDNGPWFEGSAGELRGRKGYGASDGGYRVPMIVRQPGVVPAGKRVSSIAMAIDLLPTMCALAGKPLPPNVTIDGRNISDVILRGAPTPHDQLVLFDNENVVGIRTQRWKYVSHEYQRSILFPYQGRGYPQLYDMQSVEPEQYSLAGRHPDVLADMHQRWQRATAEFAPLRSKEVPEPWRSMRQKQFERLTLPAGGSDPSKAP